MLDLMGPSGGGIFNFSGATQLNQQDKKPFNFNLGMGGTTGFPSNPTFGAVPGQSQPLASGQPVSGGTPFVTGMQASLGQTQSAVQPPQSMFGLTKPVIAPPQGGSMNFFGMPGGTPGGQRGGTANLFQNTPTQPTGGLLQASPGQNGQRTIFGQPTSSTFSPQTRTSAHKPTAGTNLFSSGIGSNPTPPSLFNLPQNPMGLTQPQAPLGNLSTTPSMQAKTGLQLGTGSPFSGGAQSQGAGSLFNPSSTYKSTSVLGTGTQAQVAGPTLFPGTQSQGTGTQSQGTGHPFQGAGLTLGTGTQSQGTGHPFQGAGLTLGTGTQAQVAGPTLFPGTQSQGTGHPFQGAGLTLGTVTQAQVAGPTLFPGTQPQGTGHPFQGAGLTLGTGAQLQSTAVPSNQQIGAQPVAGIQLPQMFSTPQNQPGTTSAYPQITPQKLTPQSAVAQGQSPLPQTLHMSHLLQTPVSQTPNLIKPTQTSSIATISASPAASQSQPARPALFQLPASQTPSSVPLVPPSTAATLIPPPATQATQLPLTSITLPTHPQGAAPPALTSTTAASIPLVSLPAPITSLSSVTQTPAKKYTYRQLEDVINSWVMELDDQQKVFLTQAKQVNAWDLALLENEDSIIALHDEVERAKTDQDRLDHDLNSILNQQAELEEMLTPLETYISSQPMHASTQHADQERNKTYSMAEKIDGSMKDMLQNLREVLERINSVNAANSDRSNPISQITGILNAHMDSLLFIDESSNSLQQKLEELSRQLDSKKQDQEAKLKTAFN